MHEPFNNTIEHECVILEVPSSSLKLIKVKCLSGGKKERAVRGMERRETDKACSFLLNGEGSQRQRSGGGEGKTEKKKTRREEEGEERWRREVSESKMTNGRHSASFCLSPVLSWRLGLEYKIVKETQREKRREREQKGCYTFFIKYPGPKPHQRV